MPTENQTVIVTDLSNREFLEKYAHPGRIGLSAGEALSDMVIRRAQRHLDTERRWGMWSHAFLFEGPRVDGHHWIIESNMEFHDKHIRLGVQENRMSKYFNERSYSTLAVLDFGLNASQVEILLSEGLELVAGRTRYSLRELVGALIALRWPELRGQDNLMARECSMFCSAFVQRLFRKANIDLMPGVHDKHTTPEDIARTPVPHITYLLQRAPARGKLAALGARMKRRVRAQIRQIKSA